MPIYEHKNLLLDAYREHIDGNVTRLADVDRWYWMELAGVYGVYVQQYDTCQEAAEQAAHQVATEYGI